jgi:hypothetical protein
VDAVVDESAADESILSRIALVMSCAVGFCRNEPIASAMPSCASTRFFSSNEVSESRPMSDSGRSSSTDAGVTFSTAAICSRRNWMTIGGRPSSSVARIFVRRCCPPRFSSWPSPIRAATRGTLASTGLARESVGQRTSA